MSVFFFFFFFFFQAEDGIRDRTVTGVQTCALPIYALVRLAETARQTDLLDQAHERVGWSRQIEHALAMQMHFTSMALLAQADGSVSLILRENNRFNDTLARLEPAAPSEERALIQAIRAAQEDA